MSYISSYSRARTPDRSLIQPQFRQVAPGTRVDAVRITGRFPSVGGQRVPPLSQTLGQFRLPFVDRFGQAIGQLFGQVSAGQQKAEGADGLQRFRLARVGRRSAQTNGFQGLLFRLENKEFDLGILA